jgi:hypothetical protein
MIAGFRTLGEAVNNLGSTVESSLFGLQQSISSDAARLVQEEIRTRDSHDRLMLEQNRMLDNIQHHREPGATDRPSTLGNSAKTIFHGRVRGPFGLQPRLGGGELGSEGGWSRARLSGLRLQQATDSLQHARNLALDDTPNQRRVCSLVVVDENVAEVIHLTPRELRVSGTKLRPDLPRSFSKDLQIPADRVEEKMRGDGAASAKTCALL